MDNGEDRFVEELVDHSSSHSYTVVARRYRPKSFEELIGQDHVAQALSKAIATGRVGHAYLFTGARGVGKTSTARIFAKALSISQEMAPSVASEIALAIDSGEDMDVIEIDGASNRRIEEIRQLRSNVNVRPSRARFKIYIIDEVHMLTKEAFNALLKTLEEPPEHVKFIFCTTDPEKIPITILSRCQRFDFVPVQLDAIQKRLVEIAQAEGFQIEADAVALLARRAAGSMRDSQSLLEQVMSFSSGAITADQIHTMLGTADESSLQSIVESLRDHDPLAAVAAANSAIASGADAGQLSEQLLNYCRDLMAVGIGGGPQTLKFANPAGYEQLKLLAQSLGVQTILSAIQILDEALVRMRASVSAMTLLEVALVQISQLQHLASIPALIEALSSSNAAVNPAAANPATLTEKKKLAPLNAQTSVVPPPKLAASSATPPSTVHSAVETSEAQAVGESMSRIEVYRAPGTGNSEAVASANPLGDALAQWMKATGSIEGILSDYCRMAVCVDVQASNAWRVVFPPGAAQARDYCEHVSRRSQLVSSLAAHCGQTIRLSFDVQPGQPEPTHQAPVSSSADRLKKMREIAEDPLIKKVCDLLDAEIVKVHPSQSLQPHFKPKQPQ
jgi:DNA polymerase-3 subunit gamma/tau